MLRHLSVENYALIEKLGLEFGPGLNIITGETGAGKSIILGAVGLLLGERGESGVQKDLSRNCVIEGVFSIDGYGLEGFFHDNDLDYAPETIVRRIISSAGKSRAYINDLPVQLTVLRELAGRLIDIHSQHENLLLKDDRFRTSILDGAAAHGDLTAHYAAIYNRWKQTLNLLAGEREKAETAARDREYISHQAEQLTAANLEAGEQEELEAEERELSNSDEIRAATGLCAAELGGDETGIVQRLRVLEQSLRKITEIYPRSAEFAERLSAAYLDLRELEREITAECERIEGNPQRLEFVGQRLGAIYSLQQKHRVRSVAELLELKARFEERLSAIEHGQETVAALDSEAAALETQAVKMAAAITQNRRKASAEVGKSVVEMLRRLGIPEARMEVEIAPAAGLRPNGADEVKFLFTANASSAPRPIEKIASGGEVSRVMLALKTMSARNAGQPAIIFDEIDTGVSGQVADAMGGIIAELAAGMQVINITHLPQIAAKSGEHFYVYKEGGSTRIRRLAPEERVTEIAKMLSGSSVTDAAVRQARELLKDEK